MYNVLLFLGIKRQSKINNDLVRSNQDKHKVPLISFKDTMTVWINQCLTSTVSLLVKLSQEEFDSKPFGTLNPLNNGGLIHIYIQAVTCRSIILGQLELGLIGITIRSFQRGK